MLGRLALIVLAWLTFALPAWAAREDNVCVQTFLIDANFLVGTADGALGPKSVKASEAFLERTGVVLPPLSNETAADWCAYLNSDESKDVIALASLTLYDVFIPDLPFLDDGSGRIAVDFADYDLTDRFDGISCSYVMRAIFADGGGHNFVSGKLAFADGGHAIFTDSRWEVGGLATPETFDRANIAITDDAQLVGRMPIYHLFAQQGGIAHEAVVVTLDPRDSDLSGEIPQGMVKFDINQYAKGEMELSCDNRDGTVAFDFSPYKLTDKFDGSTCTYAIRAIFSDGNGHPMVSGKLSIAEGGRITFTESSWTEGLFADPNTLNRANIGITDKVQLVGRMPVFYLFPQEGEVPRGAVMVTLDPKGSALDPAGPQGIVTFGIEYETIAEMTLRCQGPDGPVKIAFDFSPYKLATVYGGYTCAVTIMNIYGPDHTDPSGRASLTIDPKGKISFNVGRWMTDGPLDSFKIANLALTEDRSLVGVMDVYFIFPDPNPHPPATVVFDGRQGQFGEDLKGYAEFMPNRATKVQFQINSCRAPPPG